jgi:hypothetical protein
VKEKLKGKNIICNGYMAGSGVIALPVQAPVVMIVTEVLSVRHVMEQGKRRINQRTVTTMAKEKCKYELNKRCTHADTGDSCGGNCCCYCKHLHQMTCSFYCGIAADLVHGIEDGDNNG